MQGGKKKNLSMKYEEKHDTNWEINMLIIRKGKFDIPFTEKKKS